ncbi:methyl-accepting chemotaxis protein, partial [bacterium]
MLQKISIGTRLLLGFGLVVLFLFAAGIMAIRQIETVQELHQTFYEHPFTVINSLRDAQTRIAKMHHDMDEALLADTEQKREKIFAAIREDDRAALEKLRLVEERFLGDKQLVRDIIQELEAWKTGRENAIELFRTGKRELAAARHEEAVAGVIAKTEGDMEHVIEFAMGKAAFLSEEANAAKNRSVRFTLLFLLGATVLAAATALGITRSIVKPLGRAVEVADKLAVGDVEAEIGAVSEDETGKLLRSMDKMLRRFKSMAQTAKQISAGDLSVKVVPLSEKDVMGNALSAMVDSLSEMSESAKRIAAGDLSVKITPQSEKDVMGNALAAMVSSLREITRQMIDGVNTIA